MDDPMVSVINLNLINISGMQKNINWQSFWNEYRNVETEQESDLFFQVGKTINKIPVTDVIFTMMIEDIVKSLNLTRNDILLELCCGNGLLTFPLSNFSKLVYAFDFTKQMIDNAKKFKQKENIIYEVGDAKSNFFKLFRLEEIPNKFLINDSLAYFNLDELREIVATIVKKSKNFSFYITGIPCEELKWSFYDTEERKNLYLSNAKNGDLSNNGIGRWWSYTELEEIAREFNLKCTIQMPSKVYNYRMNVLLKK